jgi:hypothetical protein
VDAVEKVWEELEKIEDIVEQIHSATDDAGNVSPSEIIDFSIRVKASFPTLPVMAVSLATATVIIEGLIVYVKKPGH